MDVRPTPTWDHPAKWSAAVLDVVADMVAAGIADRDFARVLDPFAGVGRGRLAAAIAARRDARTEVVGVDLQPEANADDELTVVGDATRLADAWFGLFDVVATSPTFGNRMADHHDAGDVCRDCGGSGLERRTARRTDATVHDAKCKSCRGAGLSLRNTYAHSLRRSGGDLAPGSAAGLQWGTAYREVHERAIGEMIRVTVEGGLLVVNMSNHIRGGVEQRVCEWWVNAVIVAGCNLVEVRRVPTPRLGYGANGGARVDGELVIAVRTPFPRRLF